MSDRNSSGSDGRSYEAFDGPGSVSVEEIAVTFENRGAEVSVLRDTSFEIGSREVVCLLGPSGCGKSTALNVVAGLLKSYQGEVRIGGEPVVGPNRHVGYMFQQDALLPWLTAIENVRLPLDVARIRDDDLVDQLFELVQLRGFEHHRPHQLSGGMRKRIQLARLLAQQPDYLLLDEPFGALDAQTRLVIQQEFLSIWDRRPRPTLFVTHDLSEAIVMGDRILVMTRRPGRIKAEFDVEFPRPRSISSLLGTSEYQRLFNGLWSALEEEVTTTMSGAESA